MKYDPDLIRQIVLAITGLGLAASALVDACKALPGGGVSRMGFKFIEATIQRFVPDVAKKSEGTGLTAALLQTLAANWINGMPLVDQRAIAKSLIKLKLTRATAPQFARVTEVDENLLAQVADQMNAVASADAQRFSEPTEDERQLEERRAATLGRFDLALTALIDAAYQRADQRYRNANKVLSGLVAVVLAVIGGWAVAETPGTLVEFVSRGSALWPILCGILAVPLAPVAKDLTSALSAGVKVAQTLRRAK